MNKKHIDIDDVAQPQDEPHHPTKHMDVDVVALEKQVAELTEALQRERADATNIRRRHQDQLAGLKDVIKAQVVRDLLPVIDNFERALKHSEDFQSIQIPEDGESKEQDEYYKLLRSVQEYQGGIAGIVKQFEKTLEQMGVKRIKTTGQPFDPKWHEAVSMEEGDGTQEVVSEELQAGYAIGDEIVRHAMVRVKLV